MKAWQLLSVAGDALQVRHARGERNRARSRVREEEQDEEEEREQGCAREHGVDTVL